MSVIPSPSHPWSPWRPVSALGWIAAGLFFWGASYLVSASISYAAHQRAACALRWTSTKTIADSVRVAGDCGSPVPAPQGEKR